MAVFYALERGDIVKARRNLSRIVSRETQGLGPHEIIRATVESIAENIVDGIISPLFYAFLGGAPLALGYKAVNTLDSMVGYKDDRYRYFGWASARLDDLANFIPARISVVILSLASLILGKRGSCAFKIAIRDGGKNPSPNSGIPQAAMAGALEIQLGGLNIYKGKRVLKPKLGQDIQPLSLIHIKEALKIAYLSSFLMVSFGLALWALLS
jgi:adenosylcobinamide-phosphate synthase